MIKFSNLYVEFQPTSLEIPPELYADGQERLYMH